MVEGCQVQRQDRRAQDHQGRTLWGEDTKCRPHKEEEEEERGHGRCFQQRLVVGASFLC